MTSRGRVAGVEGLRASAASAIVLHHGWLYSNPGGSPLGRDGRVGTIFTTLALGVTLFFALSGFLLYRPFVAALLRDDRRPSIRAYFRNRALRILPAYWFVLVVAAVVLQSVSVRDDGGLLTSGAISDPLAFGQTALLLQNYSPETVATGIGPTWSLAVEIVFYVLLPFLSLAAWRLGGRFDGRSPIRARRVVAVLVPPAFLLVVGLSGKYMAGVVVPATPGAGYEADWHSVIERSFWAQADLFTFGMVAAVVHVEVDDGRLRLPRWWRAAVLVLAAVLFVPSARSLGSGQLSYLPQNTVIAVSAGLLLAAVAVRAPGDPLPRLSRMLEARALVAAGLVSYSLFLWNEPIALWLASHGLARDGWWGLALTLLLVAVLTAAASALTYRFVEAPALRRKVRLGREERMPIAQVEAAP